MAIAETSLEFWPDSSPGPRSGTQRILFCYAHERLARRLRDLVELQTAAFQAAEQRGYRLGPLYVEEDDSGQAMQALIDAAMAHAGAVAVAVPHRGHLIPLGAPREWQQFLEELVGHPLVFTGHTS
ncbi:hypothetical protein ACFWUU_06400 [Kribbella sp. NPDC058693]|uniref:hypothetical protein n=1 Tax=Kribbella sp. NPDC058693 TaxID=3346602 RepID=UPI003656F508